MTQLADINACWNCMYRRIFGFRKFDPIREFIMGLGRLDFTHLRYYLMFKFYRKCLRSTNDVIASLMGLFKQSSDYRKLCADAGVPLVLDVMSDNQLLRYITIKCESCI